jgi:hypothetical protein
MRNVMYRCCHFHFTTVIFTSLGTGYVLDGQGFDSRQDQENFLFSTAFRPALRPHLALYPMGTRGSFPGGKDAGA